jgi:hypothetical protein
MSSVSDYVTCKQCGFEDAYYDFNCNTNEWDVSCGRCGYHAASKRHEDNQGKVSWTRLEDRGVGVLFYHCVNSLPYVHQPLSSKESVEDAEKWLREQIAAGKVQANSAYLTRWNEQKEVVEFVIGSNGGSFPNVDLNSFGDDPPAQAKPVYDLEDESPEPEGPDDPRPFQLVEKRCQIKLAFSCDHVLDGWIVLLDGQPEPQNGQVFETAVPCLSCLPRYLTEIGRLGQYPELKRRRTELWEYRSPLAKDGHVVPAFNHPETLQEAASRFYSAHSDRKRFFPDCESAFRRQLQGVPDGEIVVSAWYAEYASTRGIIYADDFVLYLFNGAEGFAARLRKQGFSQVRALEPEEIDVAKEKVSHAPGHWGGSWKMTYPWESRSWQARR